MSHPTTTGDRVYQDIRDMITSGELSAGDRLIQRQLAAQFGTSNIPVVEAIRMLERDGLVVCHPKWGAQVRTWPMEDIEAVFVVREALETHACRLFAERASASERMKLRELNDQFDLQVAQGNASECVEADVALHRFIVDCSGSSLLYQMSENTRAITACINGPRMDGDILGPMGLHQSLVDALVLGDADEAECVCQEHIRGVLCKLQASRNALCDEED